MDSEKMNLDALVDELAPATEEFVSKIMQIANAYHIDRAQILEYAAQVFATLSAAVEIVEESDGKYERVRTTNR